MKNLPLFVLIVSLLISQAVCAADAKEEGWKTLFDGKSFNGWKASDSLDSFQIEDGALVVNGPRAHLFYVGDVGNHNFKDFEFKADVMTTPGSNSGIYFHTKYQPTGWPDWGYEVQVNHSHGDPVKTGSLYDIKDIRKSPVEDGKWFNHHIIVKGKRIVIKIDGKTVMDFTEPDGFRPPSNHPKRKIGSGTFAFQAHDPKSKVYFKNIQVKPLP